MINSPILSIVTPTLGKFSEYWLQQLLAIQGEVEFIWVYPPGAVTPSVEDPRVKIFHSLYQGETAQSRGPSVFSMLLVNMCWLSMMMISCIPRWLP